MFAGRWMRALSLLSAAQSVGGYWVQTNIREGISACYRQSANPPFWFILTT